jgi:uncharacterized protein YbcC (UPF0753/DUF2309 family)
MSQQNLQQTIQQAAKAVGTTWPLYSFVTSNPLSGYEKQEFKAACLDAYHKTGNLALPNPSFFKSAIEKEIISENEILHILNQQGFDKNIFSFFEAIDNLSTKKLLNETHEVDQLLVKWISAFLDEGLADWQMPNKKRGFYKAWISLAKYDSQLNIEKNFKFPNNSLDAIQELTADIKAENLQSLFEQHFAALPGWVGFLKYREENNTEWHKKFPFRLEDYLAVRLFLFKFLKAEIPSGFSLTENEKNIFNTAVEVLSVIEENCQYKMASQIQNGAKKKEEEYTIDAQLVFCIDTRSELIRRNIEASGKYETFGYAGFFGIAMDYEEPFSGIKRKSCPPILDSAYKVTEVEHRGHERSFKDLKAEHKHNRFKDYFLKRMKNILPSAFGYVEGAGLAYGFQLLKRSFFTKKAKQEGLDHLESTCQTSVENVATGTNFNNDEAVEIVKSAFDLMGWKNFAPIVVFAGHGSQTTNNPFASSLDCGACAASPGRHNARLLAQLANTSKVRKELTSKYGIKIPEDTWFIGAEHNTTTDEIVLFDANVPSSFQEKVNSLKKDLEIAQKTATAERLGDEESVSHAYKKSSDWSETRPEWGLAKNAGFIIGKRSLTKHLNLEGECFLHSYDWERDKDGAALNGILNGPMVVTQWINNHYYFSTVNNSNFGSGSKITHNIVGKFGVVQGNGGDLKTGLPLQSVNASDVNYYHQPQRLSVFINAPKDSVAKLLNSNPHLKTLIANRWIHLLIVDPLQNHKVEKFDEDENWIELNIANKPKYVG